MNLIRASLRQDDLPVVIGQISYSQKSPPTWKHGEIVRVRKLNMLEQILGSPRDHDRQLWLLRSHYDTAGTRSRHPVRRRHGQTGEGRLTAKFRGGISRFVT